MVIGWLIEDIGIRGGAEISGEAFLAAAPAWAEIVICRPDRRPTAKLEAAVVHNCITYGDHWLSILREIPVVKHVHDLWGPGSPALRRWILDNAALLIFNSPKQIAGFRFPFSAPHVVIPPPVDVAAFQEAARAFEGERRGVMWVGRVELAKGIQHVVDWSIVNDCPVDVWGPCYSRATLDLIVEPCRYRGQVKRGDLPGLMARYKTLIHLPVKDDVCGRVAVEAVASGLELVLGGDRRAFDDWLDLAACQAAPTTFWEVVRHGIETSQLL